MILITGDVHGDFTRFKDKRLRKLRKSDALIVCGDFGMLWDGGKREKRLLKRLGRRRYSILFVEGVHENFEELEKYETEHWCGGETRRISGNLRQLVRGNVFTIAGKTIFAFGGGKSDEQGGSVPDDPLRLKYENPSEKELSDADRALAEHSDKVDYIVSYEPPASIADFMHGGEPQTDRISAYLEEKRRNVAFGHWFFGKMHINKQIPPKFTAVFDSVIDAQTLK